MTQDKDSKQRFLADYEQFASREPALGGQEYVKLRQEAAKRFSELGFPGPKDEEWRFTSVAPLTRVAFSPAASVSPEDIRPLVNPADVCGTDCARLVFANGRLVPELSCRGLLPEQVLITTLAEAFRSHPELVKAHLARYARFDTHAFVALNTAFLNDGAFIYVPKRTVLSQPVHLMFVSTASGQPSVTHPHNLIVAEQESQLTLLESYLGADSDTYFTNAVTEIVVGESAVVDHYKYQREGLQAFHFATMQVYQERSSNFASHTVSLGAGLARNDYNTVLDGPGAESTLNGLYVIGGQQLVDFHTRVDHAQPHCASHELFKGILDGRSRGVFNGRILVRKDAQKTDAKQTNKNLLLSNQALINTNPQLEIFADDVKCTHGATIGQLDPDSLFYLRSRAIGYEQARNILVYAFANDIVRRIRLEPLRAQLEKTVMGIGGGDSALKGVAQPV